MKEKKLLSKIPDMLLPFLDGPELTNNVPFEVINNLINHVEYMPEPPFNHPIIFCGEGLNDPVCKVGFDDAGNVVFLIDGKLKFMTDEDTWINNDFGDLQAFLFDNGSEKYFLLEGTCSGEPVIED
jgi:hypothetical protein